MGKQQMILLMDGDLSNDDSPRRCCPPKKNPTGNIKCLSQKCFSYSCLLEWRVWSLQYRLNSVNNKNSHLNSKVLLALEYQVCTVWGTPDGLQQAAQKRLLACHLPRTVSKQVCPGRKSKSHLLINATLDFRSAFGMVSVTL